jgi:hypothetical protein
LVDGDNHNQECSYTTCVPCFTFPAVVQQFHTTCLLHFTFGELLCAVSWTMLHIVALLPHAHSSRCINLSVSSISDFGSPELLSFEHGPVPSSPSLTPSHVSSYFRQSGHRPQSAYLALGPVDHGDPVHFTLAPSASAQSQHWQYFQGV